MELFRKRRISVIVERAFSDRVVQLLEESGASGYTIYVDITGKGEHGVRDHHGESVSKIFGNVEIVSIVSDETAERAMPRLHAMIESGVVMIVHVVDVQVLRSEHFA